MTSADLTAPPAHRSDMRRLVRGGLLNLVGAGLSSAAGVLLVVVVTRTVPQAEAGAFFAVTSVFLVAQMLGCLGTGTGLVYFIARTRSLGRPERVHAFQRAAVVPVLVVSLVTAAVLALGAPALAAVIGGPSEQIEDAIVALAVLLPVAVVSDTVLAGTRGFSTMLPTVAVDRIGRSLLQLALVALAVGGASVTAISAAWAVPWLITAVVGTWWLGRLGRPLPPRSTDTVPTRDTWREFWGFTWARGVNSIAQLLLQRLDIVLIAALIGPGPAAIYTAATRFLVIGQLSNTAISTAAQPRLAELFAVGDRAAAGRMYQSSTAWIVLLTWPLYLLCAMFADAILAIFGPGYGGGRAVILVLAGAMLVSTACGMVDVLLNMAGRTTWTLANSTAAVCVMVVVDLLLIPPLGILGAGIGWAAAIVTNNLVPLTQLFVAYRLHPFGRSTVIAMLISATCFGAVPGLTRLLLPGDQLALLVSLVAGTALFVLVCIRWRDTLELPGLAVLRRSPTRSSQSVQQPTDQKS